jgi:hypothetical protein
LFHFSFLMLGQSGGLLGRGISPSQSATYTAQHKHRINTDIHALSGIRTHDPRVWASECSSCLRPLGHCDWLLLISVHKMDRWSRNRSSVQWLEYGLDDRGVGVRFPEKETKLFLLYSIQTGCEVHPASYPMVIEDTVSD